MIWSEHKLDELDLDHMTPAEAMQWLRAEKEKASPVTASPEGEEDKPDGIHHWLPPQRTEQAGYRWLAILYSQLELGITQWISASTIDTLLLQWWEIPEGRHGEALAHSSWTNGSRFYKQLRKEGVLEHHDRFGWRVTPEGWETFFRTVGAATRLSLKLFTEQGVLDAACVWAQRVRAIQDADDKNK